MEIPKVRKDDLGRTIWFGPASAGKFDLVSEDDLDSILDAGDAATRRQITDLVDAGGEGVLAKNSETGQFQMIDPDELREEVVSDAGFGFAQIPDDEPVSGPNDETELELVSTQRLKILLAGEDPDSDDLMLDLLESGEDAGSDPYNSD